MIIKLNINLNYINFKKVLFDLVKNKIKIQNYISFETAKNNLIKYKASIKLVSGS